MLLAFIPARGGSKGIPRKNLALLAGKPLIEYTVEAALASSCIDDILLSTDDEEIAAVCARAGVATRYRRPAPLAGDDAPMLAALQHGLEWQARERGSTPDEVLLLQPTSPLRTAVDIDGAVERFGKAAPTRSPAFTAWSSIPASAWRSAARVGATWCRRRRGRRGARTTAAATFFSTVRCIWRAPRRSSGSGASSCPVSRCSTRCRASGASTSTHRWIWSWPKPCSGCAGERCCDRHGAAGHAAKSASTSPPKRASGRAVDRLKMACVMTGGSARIPGIST